MRRVLQCGFTIDAGRLLFEFPLLRRLSGRAGRYITFTMARSPSNRQRTFLIPEDLDEEAVLQGLRGFLQVIPGPATDIHRIFLDSFDWRLYRAGTVLEEIRDAQGKRLELRGRKDGDLRESILLGATAPRFAWDFPQGGMKRRLQPILEVRALLPCVEIVGTGHTFNILNEDQKTVVRLSLESNQACTPGKSRGTSMGRRLRLVPVKGYDQEMEDVCRALHRELGFEEGRGVYLDEAFAVLGKTVAEYTSKLRFRFDPDMRTDAALKEILLSLLGVIEANMAGTRADIDSEYLHDLRVAVRRTRSALTQIRNVFDKEVVDRFKEEFAWVGQITGPTRDMDVYLIGFDRFRDRLPERYRSDLDPLHMFLKAHQKSEHRALAKRLNSARFRTLLQEWRKFLETPLPQVPLAPNAIRPVHEVAGRRILKMYKRVLKEGLAITANSPPEDLHELRKSCKKLRYLMEFFQCLYPKNKIRPLVKELKRLLDNLGEFQDRQIQADKLRAFGRQMGDEGKVPADTLLAMGMLVDGLMRGQQQVRNRLVDRFGVFADATNRKLFEQLFVPHNRSGKA